MSVIIRSLQSGGFQFPRTFQDNFNRANTNNGQALGLNWTIETMESTLIPGVSGAFSVANILTNACRIQGLAAAGIGYLQMYPSIFRPNPEFHTLKSQYCQFTLVNKTATTITPGVAVMVMGNMHGPGQVGTTGAGMNGYNVRAANNMAQWAMTRYYGGTQETVINANIAPCAAGDVVRITATIISASVIDIAVFVNNMVVPVFTLSDNNAARPALTDPGFPMITCANGPGTSVSIDDVDMGLL